MEQQTICLEELRRRVARLEAPRHAEGPPLATGCDVLDRMLPEGGFRRGVMVEWLSDEGTGAGTLALLAARSACQDGRRLAVLDPRAEFCPTAAVRLGIAVGQLLVIQPGDAADHDWAVDQVLHSPAVGAVLAWSRTTDARTLRRWQLAAEAGGTLGLLLRPIVARSEPSWADVRLLVEPLSVNRHWHDKTRPLRITLLRCRGAVAGRSVDVELDDETYRVHSLEERRLQTATG
ncbi:MAG: hypothetical protein ABFC96_11430 [Thermoguttaceae bacterium]